MAQYLAPDVYTKEVSKGARAIQGVATSVAALNGMSEKGEVDVAGLVTSWPQFQKKYGSFIANGWLAYGAYYFFLSGGSVLYVNRVVGTGAAIASKAFTGTVTGTATGTIVTVYALNEGIWGNSISIVIGDATDGDVTHYKMTVKYSGVNVEIYDNLSGDITSKVQNSDYITVVMDSVNYEDRPDNIAATSLTGGLDGADPTAAQVVGVQGSKTGFYAFDDVDEVTMLSCPDAVFQATTDATRTAFIDGDVTTIQQAMITYCETRGDMVAILDVPYGKTPAEAKDWKMTTIASTSSYGDINYPFIKFYDYRLEVDHYLPQSVFLAGNYARTDNRVGIYKAPAGTEDGVIVTAKGVEYNISSGEQEILNPAGVNCARVFKGYGVLVWGTRTLSLNPDWLYIPTRRLFNYAEESIEDGILFAVFMPNESKTWKIVRKTVEGFCRTLWRAGALKGDTEAEAFFVKCDSDINDDTTALMTVQVGLADKKPSEFVVLEISQLVETS